MQDSSTADSTGLVQNDGFPDHVEEGDSNVGQTLVEAATEATEGTCICIYAWHMKLNIEYCSPLYCMKSKCRY